MSRLTHTGFIGNLELSENALILLSQVPVSGMLTAEGKVPFTRGEKGQLLPKSVTTSFIMGILPTALIVSRRQLVAELGL